MLALSQYHAGGGGAVAGGVRFAVNMMTNAAATGRDRFRGRRTVGLFESI